MQNEAERFLWEYCPKMVHRFAAFAQRLDDQQGVNAALKWHNIAVSAHAARCVLATVLKAAAIGSTLSV